MTGKNDVSRVARTRRSRLATAEAALVPAFPEIVARHGRCRLCLLVDDDASFLRHIHDRFQEGRGVRALETETADYWLQRNEAPLDAKCFARHFKRHVNFAAPILPVLDPTAQAIAVIGAVTPEVLLLQPTSTADAASPAALAPGRAALASRPEDVEAASYFDMENLISKLRTKLEQVDQQTALVDESGKLNLYGTMLWLKVVEAFRQSLESMNRIRNNDRLTKAILQAHTKRNTVLTAAPIVARFEVVLQKVKSGAPDAVADLEKFAKEEIKEMIATAAEATIRESCEVYKLH